MRFDTLYLKAQIIPVDFMILLWYRHFWTFGFYYRMPAKSEKHVVTVNLAVVKRTVGLV